MKKYPFHLLATLFLCFYCTSTEARWATHEDATAEVELYESEVTVDKDGKAEEISEKRIKILNEAGRNSFGVERIHFNGNIEKVEIIEAKTIINGKEFPVPKETIEIKPLARHCYQR